VRWGRHKTNSFNVSKKIKTQNGTKKTLKNQRKQEKKAKNLIKDKKNQD
jgi:hypothetical protein